MILQGISDNFIGAVVSFAIIIGLCFPLHEFGHAWMATLLGDTLAQRQGRLTLNPRAHLDLMGTLMLAVAPFGWAKPVPFYPSNLYKAPNYAIGTILVASAGPLMNVLLAVAAALLWRVGVFQDFTLNYILLMIVTINLSLAVFNLIPIPPLDGSLVLAQLLPAQYRALLDTLRRYGFWILLIMIFPIPGVGNLLGLIIGPIVGALTRMLLGS